MWVSFELPWPPAILLPNKKPHWRVKAKAISGYRHTCFYLVRQQKGITPFAFLDGGIEMVITFFPPDKRRRDRDNMIASLKAGMDGFADALGVDDSRFVPTYKVGEPKTDGAVTIEVWHV